MSDDAYKRVRAGGLKLKGSLMKTKTKRARPPPPPPPKPDLSDDESEESDEEEELKVNVGSGRVSSSGLTIHGYDGTKFMEELCVGDALIVRHPTTLVDETRIVKMVLSNVSASISSPFSTDLVSTCAFRYISAPRKVESSESKEARLKRIDDAREDVAVGDYAGSGGTTFVYRKRKRGAVGGSNGYEVVRERLNEQKTRSELLEMRVKYKSDRHCG